MLIDIGTIKEYFAWYPQNPNPHSSHGTNPPFGTYSPPLPEVSCGLIRMGGLATGLPCTWLLVSICVIILTIDRSSLCEFMSSSIFDILDSSMESDESVMFGATGEAPNYPVTLIRLDLQV